MTIKKQEPDMPSHRVGAALNAVRILRHLATAQRPQRLTAIARDLGLHASNCLNLLRTLVDEQMVHHDPAAKAYSIGMGVVALAQGALAWRDSPQVVQPLLDAFSRQHAMSIMLWRRISDGDMMLVAKSVQGASVHISAEIGTRLPVLTGSMGHVIAGSGLLDEASLRRHFDAIAWGRDGDFDHFMAESRRASEQGWYLGSGDGWQGLSVLVPAALGEPVRIVNAVMLSSNYSREFIGRLANGLTLLASALAGERMHEPAMSGAQDQVSARMLAGL